MCFCLYQISLWKVVSFGVTINSLFFSKPAVKPILGNGGAERQGVFRSMSSPPPPSTSLRNKTNPAYESKEGNSGEMPSKSGKGSGNPLHEANKTLTVVKRHNCHKFFINYLTKGLFFQSCNLQ